MVGPCRRRGRGSSSATTEENSGINAILVTRCGDVPEPGSASPTPQRRILRSGQGPLVLLSGTSSLLSLAARTALSGLWSN